MVKKKSTFFADFKKFVSRGNVIDMATGVVIGASFNKIVTGLVNYVINPFVGIFIKDGDLDSIKTIITPAVVDAEGKVITPEVAILWGTWLQTILDFLIVAFCLFLILRVVMRTKNMLEADQIAAKAIADKELSDMFIRHIIDPFCPAFIYTAKHPEALIAQVGETPVRMKLHSVWSNYPRQLVTEDAAGNVTLDKENMDRWLALMEECGVDDREELRLDALLGYAEKKADWTAYAGYLDELAKAVDLTDLELCRRCTPVAKECKDETIRKETATLLQQRLDDLNSGKRQPQTRQGNMVLSGNMGKAMEMLITNLTTGEIPGTDKK